MAQYHCHQSTLGVFQKRSIPCQYSSSYCLFETQVVPADGVCHFIVSKISITQQPLGARRRSSALERSLGHDGSIGGGAWVLGGVDRSVQGRNVSLSHSSSVCCLYVALSPKRPDVERRRLHGWNRRGILMFLEYSITLPLGAQAVRCPSEDGVNLCVESAF